MTLHDICERIRETANNYGFEVTQNCFSRLPAICSEELNFLLMEKSDVDWNRKTATIRIEASASVRRMGGCPTPEELLKTAEEIQRGAELVKKLQSMELTFTETF